MDVWLVEMDPDPTRAYFLPAVNKRPTRLWPGYFPTWPEAIFFDPKGKKLKNLTFLGEIFGILTKTINVWPDPTRPEPQKIDPTRSDPGQKFLTRTHHYWLGQVKLWRFLAQNCSPFGIWDKINPWRPHLLCSNHMLYANLYIVPQPGPLAYLVKWKLSYRKNRVNERVDFDWPLCWKIVLTENKMINKKAMIHLNIAERIE